MCDKAVNSFFVFDSIPDWYKTQEMCDRAIYDPFMPFYYPDRYETQKCIMKLLIFFRSIKIYS